MKSKVYVLYTFFIFHFSFFTSVVNGQPNLVLNPSFEQYSGQCRGASLNYNCTGSTIPGWYVPTYSPGHWYNSCNNGISPDAGVPSNYCGYQFPHSGQAYGEVWAGIGNYRNYVTGQFSKNLVTGRKYCVSFYISLGDSISWYALSAIGAFISDTAPCVHNTYGLLTGIPQIENPSNNLLSDKIDWVPVSGEYLAKGGEQYITIGDFYYDSMSDFTYIGGGAEQFRNNVDPEPSYYLDDVSVRLITFANALNGKKDTTICMGNAILIGEDTATPGVTYQWLPAMGLQNPNAAQTIASPTVTTTYTLYVHNDSMFAWNAVGGCHCPDSVSKDSVTVKVFTVNGNVCCARTITQGQSIQLSASGGDRYAWSPPAKGCDTCSNLTAEPLITTIYIVTIKDTNGCTTKDSVTVTVLCRPVSVCCDSSIIRDSYVQLSSSGGNRYYWSPSTALSCDTCSDPIASPTQNITYTITINDSGCISQRTITIDVACGSIFIPDAFSPGGGFGSAQPPNNILYVRGPCIATMDFIIFDRWGNKVFESQKQSEGWDGTYKGQAMNTGTYFYYLTAKMNDGTSVEKKGNVALVR